MFSVADQKASTIACLFVEHIIRHHGVPERLLSDCGPNFLSTLLLEECKLMGVTKVSTSGYHPQCDCPVENSMLISMLSKSVEKHTHDWDAHLPHVLFALRVAVYDSTRSFPLCLLYGQEPMLPTEVTLSQLRMVYLLDCSDYLVADFHGNWLARIFKLHKKNRSANIKKESTKSKLRVNDRVMVHFPGMVKRKVGMTALWALLSDIHH